MKIWIVVTDTRDGSTIHKFDSEAEFDSFMDDFISNYYAPSPTWKEAWEAHNHELGEDSFQFDTFDVEPKRKWSIDLTRTDHFEMEVEADSPEEAMTLAKEIICQSEDPYATYGTHCDGFDVVGCR